MGEQETYRTIRASVTSDESDQVLNSIYEKATETDDVKPDCWGALEFAIVNDLPDILVGKSTKQQKVRTLCAFTFYVFNIVIQGGLLYFIFKLLMMPAFKEAQGLYMHFHSAAFINGTFDLTAFEDFPEKKRAALCNIALDQSPITQVLLFLWISTTLSEFIVSSERFFQIWNFPSLPKGCSTTCMVKDEIVTGSTEFWCICLNRETKIFLNTFIHLPKCVIALVLSFVGSFWLIASESFGDLILNSLALGFVTTVDELLATTFFPGFFNTECVEPFKYKCKKHPMRDTEEGAMSWRIMHYCGSFLKFAVALAVVQGIMMLQQVVPGYEFDLGEACRSYVEEQWPWCAPFQTDCFPTD